MKTVAHPHDADRRERRAAGHKVRERGMVPEGGVKAAYHQQAAQAGRAVAAESQGSRRAQGRDEDRGASVKPRDLQQYRCGVDRTAIRGSSRRSPGAHPPPDDQADEADALHAPPQMPLPDWIAMRLRIPATPSEIAHSARVPLRSVRAILYQLRDQGRAIRLDRRVPKASPRGRQWEYLWSAP